MSDPAAARRLLHNAYRELLVCGSAFLVSLVWTVGVCVLWGFQHPPESWLARSGWAGQTPWDALHALGGQLGLPALGDLSDIMRLGGEEGAQVVTTLRARAEALRTQVRTDAVTHANNTAERLTFPGLVMAALFVTTLVGPGVAALFSG